MKKTILDPEARAHMYARLAKLRPDSPALWGTMNAGQCLAHLADQLRMALGHMPVAGKPPFLGRTFVRWLVLAGMPAPKGKVQTLPELDQRTAGTKPGDFETDRATMRALVEELLACPDSFVYQVHPFFGYFNKRQWSKMVWSHMDHHLAQFGC